VVEHTLGKGEVGGSIPLGSTSFLFREINALQQLLIVQQIVGYAVALHQQHLHARKRAEQAGPFLIADVHPT
jgi:hypothetical protein